MGKHVDNFPYLFFGEFRIVAKVEALFVDEFGVRVSEDFFKDIHMF